MDLKKKGTSIMKMLPGHSVSWALSLLGTQSHWALSRTGHSVTRALSRWSLICWALSRLGTQLLGHSVAGYSVAAPTKMLRLSTQGLSAQATQCPVPSVTECPGD
jgi:hypothetical protein